MTINVFILYLSLINLITFMVFAIDKRKARLQKWRISEGTLLCLSIIGGSIGALAAMYTFRHKTRKIKFSLGVPVIILLQSALIYICDKI